MRKITRILGRTPIGQRTSVRKALAALATKPEIAIDFSDLPATSSKNWRGAVRGQFYKPVTL